MGWVEYFSTFAFFASAWGLLFSAFYVVNKCFHDQDDLDDR